MVKSVEIQWNTVKYRQIHWNTVKYIEIDWNTVEGSDGGSCQIDASSTNALAAALLPAYHHILRLILHTPLQCTALYCTYHHWMQHYIIIYSPTALYIRIMQHTHQNQANELLHCSYTALCIPMIGAYRHWNWNDWSQMKGISNQEPAITIFYHAHNESSGMSGKA